MFLKKAAITECAGDKAGVPRDKIKGTSVKIGLS
jgi:hypothetical protein